MHGYSSVEYPAHTFPPYLGSGLVQLLCLSMTPPPHSTVAPVFLLMQGVTNVDQGDHTPSTGSLLADASSSTATTDSISYG